MPDRDRRFWTLLLVTLGGAHAVWLAFPWGGDAARERYGNDLTNVPFLGACVARLELELTERLVVRDVERAAAKIAELRALDIEVVAQGGEPLAQLGGVRDLGCERVQGFLFGRPVLAEQARALLMRRFMYDA